MLAEPSASSKIFVLDTNVILHDSGCIRNFAEHDIAIPITVLEELDQFKRGNEDINFQAREFLRRLDDLTGSAEIVLNSEKETLLAPRSAVFEEAGASYVYIQGAEGWTRKKVDLGVASFTIVAIRSGVQKGDVIALQRPL